MMYKYLPLLLAIFLLLTGLAHLMIPNFYEPLIPEVVHPHFANIAAAIAEISTACLLLFKKTQKIGGIAFAILMLLFLPIHILDLISEVPVVGSKTTAVLRLLLQGVFIYLGWSIWKSSKD
ncbi:hypothetical protein [Algivirga pacifica]|uniref:DoxX family membrane protein n=1 Tax=Algivirga pacifica TaxID=1162670 RepID=A0ABP9DC37_9BACT